MRYAVVFGLLAAMFILYAFMLADIGWILLWPGTCFALLALAYARNEPRMIGKRPSGRIALWAIVVYLPYFMLTWTMWHINRRRTAEPPCQEVLPGLWLARRPLPHEMPPTVTHIVDLTCEFIELPLVRHERNYRCLPILDGMIPTVQQLHDEAHLVVASDGIVMIHCAVGHGRTGLMGVAVLLIRGVAPDVTVAVQMLRAVRPEIRLNPAQRRCAEQFAARLAANPN